MIGKLVISLLVIFFTTNLFGQKEIIEQNKRISCFQGYYNNGQVDLNIYKDSTYKMYCWSYRNNPYFYNVFDSGKVVIKKNKIQFLSFFENAPVDISDKVDVDQYYCCFSTYKVVPDSIEITLRNFTHFTIKNVVVIQKDKEIYSTKLLNKDEVIKIRTLNTTTSTRDTIKLFLNKTEFSFLSDKEMRLTLGEIAEKWIKRPIFKSAKIIKDHVLKIQDPQIDKTAGKATLTNAFQCP